MPKWLAVAVFAVVVAQVLCALVIIILLLAAPSYATIAVKAFGALIALRSGFFVIYGLVGGDLSSQGWRATRAFEPTRFWSRVMGNLVGVGIGIFLMLLPIR